MKSRIAIKAGICSGAPRIDGTRITTACIESWRKSGVTLWKVIQEYPTLTELDVVAAIAFEHGRRFERARRAGKRKEKRA